MFSRSLLALLLVITSIIHVSAIPLDDTVANKRCQGQCGVDKRIIPTPPPILDPSDTLTVTFTDHATPTSLSTNNKRCQGQCSSDKRDDEDDVVNPGGPIISATVVNPEGEATNVGKKRCQGQCSNNKRNDEDIVNKGGPILDENANPGGLISTATAAAIPSTEAEATNVSKKRCQGQCSSDKRAENEEVNRVVESAEVIQEKRCQGQCSPMKMKRAPLVPIPEERSSQELETTSEVQVEKKRCAYQCGVN